MGTNLAAMEKQPQQGNIHRFLKALTFEVRGNSNFERLLYPVALKQGFEQFYLLVNYFEKWIPLASKRKEESSCYTRPDNMQFLELKIIQCILKIITFEPDIDPGLTGFASRLAFDFAEEDHEKIIQSLDCIIIMISRNILLNKYDILMTVDYIEKLYPRYWDLYGQEIGVIYDDYIDESSESEELIDLNIINIMSHNVGSDVFGKFILAPVKKDNISFVKKHLRRIGARIGFKKPH